MRTVLLILGIWLLFNLMFVLLVTPSRKRREADAERSCDPSRREEETMSLRHIIVTAGLAAFFVLSPPIAHAIDSIKRVFTKTPPAD
jgi:hypothetical protein